LTWWAWLIVAFLVVELVFAAVGIPLIVRRNGRRAREAPPPVVGPGALRGPEKGSYEGGTGSFPKVSGRCTITLTESSLRFDRRIGKTVDIPVDSVRGVRTATTWFGSWRGGNVFVIVQTTEGDAGFLVRDADGWASAIADAAQVGPHVVATNSFATSAVCKILAIVFTSIGVLLGLVSGISGVTVSQSISGNTSADGIVVGNSSGGKSSRAVVEFTSASGATIRFTSGIATSPGYPIGSHVDVRYNPQNPQDAVIDEYWQIWFFPTVFAILGAPFLSIGVTFGAVALLGRRRSGSVTTDR
jgi:hypothetical protein